MRRDDFGPASDIDILVERLQHLTEAATKAVAYSTASPD